MGVNFEQMVDSDEAGQCLLTSTHCVHISFTVMINSKLA